MVKLVMRKTGFLAILTILGVYCLAPLIWQGITSLKPDTEITRIPPIFPKTYTLIHYENIFKQHRFARLILNSIVVASTTTLFAVSIGSIAAFALAKLKVTGKTVILGFMLSVSMFPPITTVSPLYLVIRTLGLRNTWWALMITYTTFSLPLTVWILTNFFKDIPGELYLAARIDGCSPFEAYRKVMFPIAAPGVFATAILVFIFSWNEFLFALTFTVTESSRTIPVGIALFPGIHEIPWGDMAAASVVVTVPLVILVFMFGKKIVEGLTAGAVKG